MTKPIRYNTAITIRANPEVIETIHKLAKARSTKPSEWIRNAISLAIELENGARQT
jgi:predicted transcriptional regulator